jgi:hypothetical protein
MTSTRHTHSLVLLLIASAIASAGAWSMLDTRRSSAIASQKDRAICLSELSAIGNNSSAADPQAADSLTLSRRLRGAAVAAHLGDQLASIDPGSPARVRDSDYMQTPIYLRLNAVSLRQLVAFLYELSITDNSLRTTDIELTPPLTTPVNRPDPGDLWLADITLSCLTYQQRPPAESR